MELIKRFISGMILFLAVVILFSCHLEDFNLNKLSKTNDIVPDVYAPLAYGTFTVANLVPLPAPVNSTPIPNTGMEIPLVISKSGTSFSSAAIDSVYLITHFTNDTPCEMEFNLSFVNAAGVQIGNPFPSGKIAVGAQNFRIPLFDLNPIDQNYLNQATNIKLNFRLFPSAAARTYGDVKAASFSFKISFRAPVNLQKL